MDENAKILQQLRQKTDEVEKLFAEARYLDQENMQLRDAVSAAKRGLIEAEHQITIKDSECRTLESTVRAQQNTIQELLNAEMARASGKPLPQSQMALPPPKSVPPHRAAASIFGEKASPSTTGDANFGGSQIPPTPTLPPAAIAQLEKELDEALQKIESQQLQLRNASKAADEFKKGAAVHAEEMNRLQNRVKQIESDANHRVEAADGRAKQADDKAKSLQDAIVLMREQHKQLLAEAQHLEGVDAQAREGVRVEWMALASENERLMRVADEAASVQARVRQEHERIVSQLVSQRNHFDASAGVLRRELEAVHEENDRLLVNFQRVAAERDSLRRDVERADTLSKQQLDVDSSVVAARELRRQISDATASSQSEAARAQSLERDLIRARDDITNLRGEVERSRGELAERDARLTAARRDIELAKRNNGEMDHLQAELDAAQRKLREMMNKYETQSADPQQLGAFVDEVDATTAELVVLAHEAASFLSPVPVAAPALSAAAQAGSPRRDTIKQRLAELRGLIRWLHTTLGDITAASSGQQKNMNHSSSSISADRASVGYRGNQQHQNSKFNIVGATNGSAALTTTSSAGLRLSNNNSGGGDFASLRDLSTQREF